MRLIEKKNSKLFIQLTEHSAHQSNRRLKMYCEHTYTIILRHIHESIQNTRDQSWSSATARSYICLHQIKTTNFNVSHRSKTTRDPHCARTAYLIVNVHTTR